MRFIYRLRRIKTHQYKENAPKTSTESKYDLGEKTSNIVDTLKISYM